MNFLSISFPNISPEIFSIGGFSIKWYGLAYVGSILIGWKYVSIISKKSPSGISRKNIDDLVVWVALGIIVGGRLGYTIFYQPLEYLQNPIKILEIWNGGMSFHGGLIGVIFSTIIFSKIKKIDIFHICDMLAIVTPIGLFFGRLTNFINQELWGKVTSVPWAVEFPLGGYLPRHPSQIYEALFEGLFLYLVLALLWHFTKIRYKPGVLTGIFVSGYSFFRIFIEFFREPDSHLGYLFYVFSMGQILSFPLLIFGIVLIILNFYRKHESN
ncbi:MAG: Prolipoprotein diacylglyceryl transferase [Alphaproteobacteria bacterium MarineAlpha2_Bin1]|nr:MAG: Prolipoprotein diacylglyceryl transferase [Alphaproteobacteria bacterium MarineAlpha2_Bin1]